MHDEVFAYHLETHEVRQLAPMPKAISHSECAVGRVGSKIIVAGGVFDRKVMAKCIYVYDLDQDHWDLMGLLPHPMKSKVTAIWKDRIYHRSCCWVESGPVHLRPCWLGADPAR